VTARLPTGEDKVRAVRTMFDRIAPRYDLMNRLMTFGMDVGWRKRSVAMLDLPKGSLVFDLACGTGDFCNVLRRAELEPVGFDLSLGMLVAATASAPLVQADALQLPVGDGGADGITCGFALRNVTDVDALFRECARVLRHEGRVAMLEVSRPRSRALRAAHRVYFDKIVPRLGGLISDRDAYSYLPASTAYLPPTLVLLERLRSAGFDDVRATPMGLGAVQVLTGTRR
jgi:demethylmenaquinone methyltransferase/2-methoxy-6-polyprenyl-1,4-benzoquinol methylase